MGEQHKTRTVLCGQGVPVARSARPGHVPARRLPRAWLPVLLALVVALPASPLFAQSGDRQASPRERAEDRQPRRHEVRPERRDELHDERRRRFEERHERMTPEERRGLRRDLHEAKRDLYQRER